MAIGVSSQAPSKRRPASQTSILEENERATLRCISGRGRGLGNQPDNRINGCSLIWRDERAGGPARRYSLVTCGLLWTDSLRQLKRKVLRCLNDFSHHY
jgi:hypothetical protein